MSEAKPSAVGLHVFAGGFSVGVRAAGFEVAGHLESTPYGVSTAQANLDVPVFWPEARWPLEALAGEVDLLHANPPCAPFSMMGATHDAGPGSEAWRLDPRTGCWWDVLRVAAAVRPRAVLLESVAQAYGTGRPLVDEFTRLALGAGYHVTHLFVDARRHRLPQARRRFLLCFTAAAPLALAPLPEGPTPTVGEVLASVLEPGHYSAPSQFIELARRTRPGGALYRTYDEIHGDSPPKGPTGKRAGRPSFQDKRLDPESRDGFVVAGDKLWHPSGERRLGVEELKALCGFPRDFKLTGPPGGHASLLARGLMPPVAQWVAACVAATLRTRSGGPPSVRLVDASKQGLPISSDLTAEYVAGGGRSRRDPKIKPPERGLERPRPTRAVSTTPRAAASGTSSLPPLEAGSGPPAPGEGSGRYMQRLLLAGLSGDECVTEVHRYFSGRRTKRSDAYYNWNALRAARRPDLPPWRPS